MKRCVSLLALSLALLAAGSAGAVNPGQAPGQTNGGLPFEKTGSSIGEGHPFKAYASMSPTVHLFGDVVTARLAVIADTKWVNPQQLRVRASFAPYVALHKPQVLRLHSGRFLQVTWTWQLRCLASPCVPRRIQCR